MINILIADDHAIVRKGLKQILADTPDMTVADEASDGREVLDKIRKRQFDIIVLDITMPGMSGLDVLTLIKKEKPKLPVLVLSIHPEDQYAVRVLKAGASGYLTKDSAPEELVEAILRVSRGRKYISDSLAESLASELNKDDGEHIHNRLSHREFEVMCLIASGKTVREIAGRLYLSVKTVSTYRSRLLQKMGMKNNAELTRYALKNRLID